MNTFMDTARKANIYEQALKNYFGSVLITDENLNIIFANQHSARMLDTSVEELLKMNMYDIIENGLAQDCASIEVFDTHKPVFRYILNGKGEGMYISARPCFDQQGKLECILTYSQDDTFINSYLNQITEIKQQAEGVINLINNASIETSFIAESENSKQMFSLARRVAQSDTTVMLYGESGSGKEVVSKFIHDQSNRSKNLFVPVNCAAIPEQLMESEFFGYEKGAFTGANSGGKLGIFELANHGTLFLDEIGEMPLPLQAKLLRVLETGEFLRVGGTKKVSSDIRIIAATNRNLSELVEEGRFRQDLYYRLNIVPIVVSPLRARKEDIVPLSQFFLKKLNEKYGKNKILVESTLSRLQEYSWPGNIRELKNIIERLYITSSGDYLILNGPLDLSLSEADASSTILNCTQSDQDLDTKNGTPPQQNIKVEGYYGKKRKRISYFCN
ncbi:MAG: sigma-54 interaction domain-containing protein [Anaerovoracaceae bacterium]